MKTLLPALLLVLTPALLRAQDALDRLDDFLTVNIHDGQASLRLSGTLDVEAYHVQQPAPGLIYTQEESLVNPRLTLYLDAQLGPYVYAFAQARLDRGFDPADQDAEMRMDEYALRVSPWDDGRLSIQVGKFSTVMGNWVARHDSWSNPFITAPAPYENLTGIWDYYAADGPDTLLGWGHVDGYALGVRDQDDKDQRLPIIWGPAYTTGVSVSGRLGHFEYAAELKNAAPASRPDSWDLNVVSFGHPAYAARIGYRPNLAWSFGISASSAPYLRPEAQISLPPGRDIGDYRELILAQDISYSHGHLQLWAEFFETRFEVPHVGDADTFAYYLEAKYKFSESFFGAVRWNQQVYGDIAHDGDFSAWGQDLWRVDLALGYRPTPHTQLKLQYSLEHRNDAERQYGNVIAGQVTLRF